MIRTIPIFVLAVGMLCGFAGGRSFPQLNVPSDADIRQILLDRIDLQHRSVGIVVGVIAPEARRVITYGQLEKGDTRPLNGDTIFEIGSETKVFTSLLLADMVQRGEVALGDPVAKYLPPGTKCRSGTGVRLRLSTSLRTHQACHDCLRTCLPRIQAILMQTIRSSNSINFYLGTN